MQKVLYPTKDAYVTSRVIDGTRRTDANVGAAASLDLYKLYGLTSTTSGSTQLPNVELSRLLIKFDLDPLSELVAQGRVDVGAPTFRCELVLYDVYAGQPTPSGFNVEVYPLSASFDEGIGRDVVLCSDNDVCNWLTGSSGQPWLGVGCSAAGDSSDVCDYITGSFGIDVGSSQLFVTGEEDLRIDVTRAVSGTLAGLLPDKGFRITLGAAEEADQHTYFVKRFAARTAFNDDLRPRLVASFDDSLQDDTANMYLDSPGYMFLRSYRSGVPAALKSGSTNIVGDNCLLLALSTPVSGGTYVTYFTGSQHRLGIHPQTGLYSASVVIGADEPSLVAQWQQSGSVTFTPRWTSLDGSVVYHLGAPVVFALPERGTVATSAQHFNVSVHGIRDRLLPTESSLIRVNLFDTSLPQLLRAVRIPVESPGVVVRDAHYQVRDAVTRRVVIPFDTVRNTTRLSNDTLGMYFVLDAANLTPGRSYVIDVLIIAHNDHELHLSASPAFKVADAV